MIILNKHERFAFYRELFGDEKEWIQIENAIEERNDIQVSTGIENRKNMLVLNGKSVMIESIESCVAYAHLYSSIHQDLYPIVVSSKLILQIEHSQRLVCSMILGISSLAWKIMQSLLKNDTLESISKYVFGEDIVLYMPILTSMSEVPDNTQGKYYAILIDDGIYTLDIITESDRCFTISTPYGETSTRPDICGSVKMSGPIENFVYDRIRSYRDNAQLIPCVDLSQHECEVVDLDFESLHKAVKITFVSPYKKHGEILKRVRGEI